MLYDLINHENLNVKCNAIFIAGDRKISESFKFLKAAVLEKWYGDGHTKSVSRFAIEALGKL